MPPRRSTRLKADKDVSVTVTKPEILVEKDEDVQATSLLEDDEQGSKSEEHGEEITNTKCQKETNLSAVQRARVENNRQRAMLIRRNKEAEARQEDIAKKKLKQTVQVEVDTGAGFFIEDEDQSNINYDQIFDEPFVIAGDGTDVECCECCKPFHISFLRSKFGYNVCDECKDKEKHKLITKSNAKVKYLLKDEDFDKREPILKFITKKNPRNNHWGEMKLYLECQVYDRAMEIWGSLEGIEEETIKRKILSAKAKAKKYDKKMKELRMEVRSSLYKRDISSHTHEYGAETYNEADNEYSKQCVTCGHTLTYEKM